MSRTRLQDIQAAVLALLGSVLLASPVGLLWSALAPRAQVVVTARGPDIPDVESNKAFIGADGSYVVITLLAGVVCGLLAWRFLRKGGPWTVAALTLGGLAAALVAARVGLIPGAQDAIKAVSEGSSFRGNLDLYLGRFHQGSGLDSHALSLRAAWACVFWPAGALIAFLAAATLRPDELD